MISKRVFVAIELSDEAVKAVSAHTEQLKREFPNVKARWVPSRNLHVTLHFVGNIEVAKLADLENRVAKVAAAFPPVTLTLEGTGAFIRRKSRSNVLWLGISSRTDNGLAGVLEGITEALSGSDPLAAASRRAHVTIARLSDPKNAGELVDAHLAKGFGPILFHVPEIVIYESRLTQRGSFYTPLSRYRLLL